LLGQTRRIDAKLLRELKKDSEVIQVFACWWVVVDLNHRPKDYELFTHTIYLVLFPSCKHYKA
jgi:hypothetical protein